MPRAGAPAAVRRRLVPALRPLVVSVLALALASAACSGDDARGPGDGGGAGAPTSTTTSIAFTGSAQSPFCAVLRDLAVDDVLERESSSPAEVEAAYTHLLEVLHRAADASPPELQADTALILAGIGSLDDALRAVGYDYDALSTSPQGPSVVTAVNDPAFTVAGDRVQAYKHQVCGL